MGTRSRLSSRYRFLTISINRLRSLVRGITFPTAFGFSSIARQRIAARSPITDNGVRQRSLYWESSECGVPGGSCRLPENRGNFNRFRILGFLSLLFAHIVARVPSPFYRAMYKPGRRKGRSGARVQEGANRYAAPFPSAVLRSARWQCSCSCGRSCGSSVGDAFCGRAGRYAVIRIVVETSPSPINTSGFMIPPQILASPFHKHDADTRLEYYSWQDSRLTGCLKPTDLCKIQENIVRH